MSQKTIIVYIDEKQLVAQKVNNHSLYLARKVNETFTVIWVAKPPLATVNQSTYQYQNIFSIQDASYMVNYTNAPVQEGDVSFASGGKSLPIAVGQVTKLNQYGVFSAAENDGAPGDVSIDNQLQGNPSEMLLDSKGLKLWVNCSGGMNKGLAAMTPRNEFQLWFGPVQVAGSLIPKSLSNVCTVSVGDGQTETVTYNAEGDWVSGQPRVRLTKEAVIALQIRVDKAVKLARASQAYNGEPV
ncbi:hypothetical protein ACW5XW_11795 [Aeromonas piscicola]|uniref:hypothetical protein n=1 Tax=Aeromonas piscicola TaxID=600645 RepID=UPI0005B3F76F|nr:hypothetical protein [Aeromonas piscicola]